MTEYQKRIMELMGKLTRKPKKPKKDWKALDCKKGATNAEVR